MGGTAESVREATAHEVTHLVQGTEGFARGTSRWSPEVIAGAANVGGPERIVHDALNAEKSLWQERWVADRGVPEGAPGRQDFLDAAAEEWKRLFPERAARLQQAADALSFEAYQRVAGEVEARAVTGRLLLSPAQRRGRPPWLDEDRPREQQTTFGPRRR